MLELQNVSTGYGTGQILFDINLGVKPGQVLGLLGRNGMGKSTLIKSILGLLPLYSGHIEFANQNITGLSADKIARLGMGIVPEGRQCFPNLSVLEHLTAFTAVRNPNAQHIWSVDNTLDLFPRLRERAKNLGHQLSGGEQQMLAIARALITNPKLLILDEATEGLAPRVRAEIWACLNQISSAGQTIIIVDKYVERLIQLAHSHIILEKGNIVWQGSSQELDQNRDLWVRYLGI